MPPVRPLLLYDSTVLAVVPAREDNTSNGVIPNPKRGEIGQGDGGVAPAAGRGTTAVRRDPLRPMVRLLRAVQGGWQASAKRRRRRP